MGAPKVLCQTTQHLQHCGEIPQHGIQSLVVFTTQLQVHVCRGMEGGRGGGKGERGRRRGSRKGRGKERGGREKREGEEGGGGTEIG